MNGTFCLVLTDQGPQQASSNSPYRIKVLGHLPYTIKRGGYGQYFKKGSQGDCSLSQVISGSRLATISNLTSALALITMGMLRPPKIISLVLTPSVSFKPVHTIYQQSPVDFYPKRSQLYSFLSFFLFCVGGPSVPNTNPDKSYCFPKMFPMTYCHSRSSYRIHSPHNHSDL